MKRDAAQTIFRTVVFAGAMLGAPACKKNNAQTTTPQNTATQKVDPPGGNTTGGSPDTATPATADGDPCAGGEYSDPCAGDDRPRGTDDDGGGGMGRGFVLS